MEPYVVGVVFQESEFKTYSFLADISLAPDDIVIVSTSRGLKIARVVSLLGSPGENPVASAWVIDKVRMTEFQTRQSLLEKKTELRTKLDARTDAVMRFSAYESLAQKDPEAAEWLRQLKEIGSV